MIDKSFTFLTNCEFETLEGISKRVRLFITRTLDSCAPCVDTLRQ